MRDIMKRIANTIGLLMAMFLAVLLASALTDRAGAQEGAKASVKIIDFGFESVDTKVKAGTTVTFTNAGERPHTVTDRGGTFDTQPLDPGASGAVNFSAPGVYSIFCRINPSKMNGTITVEPGPEPAKVVRVQAVDDGNIVGEKLRFDPPQLTVKAGTTLLFANAGGKPHSLSAEDGSFSTGIVQPGAEKGRFAGTNAVLTLNKPGTFNFFCDIHPQAMKGTLTVSGDAVAGGPPPPSAGARSATVDMEDFAFKDPQVSVGPGAEITFVNKGQAPHTATLDDVPGVDTGKLDAGATGKLTAPNAPGSYSYKCTLHPAKMRGVLVVLGQSTPDPIREITATTTGAALVADGSGGTKATAVPSPPPTANSKTGPGGIMKIWVLLTLVVGSILAGIGIGPFLSRRRSPA